MLPQAVRYGFLGPVHWAVVEACDVTAGGGIVLTSSVGATPTFAGKAEKILIELNRAHPATLLGMHDIYEPVYKSSDRIGSPLIRVDPSRIAGIVETDIADDIQGFDPATPATDAIGQQVTEFLASELKVASEFPNHFLPIQSGVGNIANASSGRPGKPPANSAIRNVHRSIAGLRGRSAAS